MLGTFIGTQNTAALILIAGFIDAGKVTPVIDRTCPRSEAAKALRYLQDGQA
jgi:hypothetical protein